ncbi:MAG: tRNA (adenosine(37)-N6)-dimethylallyltransferase MiaA [Rhodospirillaceae bacterium]|jgi:tRNA dimethylallyltransferase|nr:tRNA (adenosine(37)-N6)-dimethylallyltransferase MiaA [Rhodospirillaceae bacterium]
MTREQSRTLVIAGPTASGKSGLAFRVAEELNGVVINADSMQVYSDLRVLTARPSADDEARVPHKLYGYLDGADGCTAAAWAARAAEEITNAHSNKQVPIVVGGTGLYLKALIEGLSDIPEVPLEIRQTARRIFLEQGNDALYQSLLEKDPEGAVRLKPKDHQRVLRAWEVVEATGTPLHVWQAKSQPKPLINGPFHTVLFQPPREDLYAACNGRFEVMLEGGALAEVEALLARGLNPALPVMKALGVPELAAFVRGETSHEDAVTKAQQHTRNYAKRQVTWFRGQFNASETLNTQYSESLFNKIFPKIR